MAIRSLNLEMMLQKGVGMYLDGDTTQGLWSVSESHLHINELELKGHVLKPEATKRPTRPKRNERSCK